MVKLKRRPQFNMNIFKEMSASVNNESHRDVEIIVTDEYMFITYLNSDGRDTLRLHRKKCFPCKYDLEPSVFEFFMEEQNIQLRFARRDDKNNFWKLVFPHWQYYERYVQPTNSPALIPSPPLVPANSPASSETSSTE